MQKLHMGPDPVGSLLTHLLDGVPVKIWLLPKEEKVAMVILSLLAQWLEHLPGLWDSQVQFPPLF